MNVLLTIPVFNQLERIARDGAPRRIEVEAGDLTFRVKVSPTDTIRVLKERLLAMERFPYQTTRFELCIQTFRLPPPDLRGHRENWEQENWDEEYRDNETCKHIIRGKFTSQHY